MHKHVEGRFMYNEMPDVKDIQKLTSQLIQS